LKKILLLYLITHAVLAQGAPAEIDVGPPKIIYPENLSIVDEHQISTPRAGSSEDTLRTVPGLIVTRSGGLGQPSFIFIRGADSDGTLVLIDGIRANDPSTTNTSFDFSTLSINNLDHIEIWKGPQSVLFGSGAIGGVINFVTKKGHGPLHFDVGLEGGSWNTTQADVSARGSTDSWTYSLAAERVQTDGISVSDSPPGPRDGASAGSYSARIGFSPEPNSEIELLARWSDKKAALGFAPSDTAPYFIEPNPLNYRMNDQALTLSLLGNKRWSEALASNFSLARSGIERRYNLDPDPSNTSWVRGHFAGDDYQGKITTIWQPRKSLSVQFGFETETQSAASEYLTNLSTSLQPHKWATITGGFARVQMDQQFYFMTCGFRNDDSSMFGGQSSYEISPGLHLTENTDFSVRAATSYKQPSLYQLFAPIYGNPSLEPQQVDGYEASLSRYLLAKALRFEVTGFRYHYKNLVQFEANHYDNVGSADTSGVEGVIGFQHQILRLDAGYTYLETRDDSSGQSLIRRPRNLYSGRLEINPSGKWSGMVEWTGLNRRMDLNAVTNQSTVNAGYQVWNASVTWQPKDSWKVYVRAVNLFNQNYEEVSGYSTYPLSFYAGGIYSL